MSLVRIQSKAKGKSAVAMGLGAERKTRESLRVEQFKSTILAEIAEEARSSQSIFSEMIIERSPESCDMEYSIQEERIYINMNDSHPIVNHHILNFFFPAVPCRLVKSEQSPQPFRDGKGRDMSQSMFGHENEREKKEENVVGVKKIQNVVKIEEVKVESSGFIGNLMKEKKLVRIVDDGREDITEGFKKSCKIMPETTPCQFKSPGFLDCKLHLTKSIKQENKCLKLSVAKLAPVEISRKLSPKSLNFIDREPMVISQRKFGEVQWPKNLSASLKMIYKPYSLPPCAIFSSSTLVNYNETMQRIEKIKSRYNELNIQFNDMRQATKIIIENEKAEKNKKIAEEKLLTDLSKSLFHSKASQIPLKHRWFRGALVTHQGPPFRLFSHIPTKSSSFSDKLLLHLYPTSLALITLCSFNDPPLDTLWESFKPFITNKCNSLPDLDRLNIVSTHWITFLKFIRRYSRLKPCFSSYSLNSSTDSLTITVTLLSLHASVSLPFSSLFSSYDLISNLFDQLINSIS